MQRYRYSLGLLELVAGFCILILAVSLALMQTFDVYPPLALLPAFAAPPLLFWVTSKVQERLPANANLTTYVYSRPATLIALGVFLLLPYVQFLLMPGVRSGGPTFAASLVSGGIVMVRGLGPRVAYLVGGTLLLGLGLALYGPPSYATVIFCSIVGLVLITGSFFTLNHEWPR